MRRRLRSIGLQHFLGDLEAEKQLKLLKIFHSIEVVTSLGLQLLGVVVFNLVLYLRGSLH